LSPKHSDLSDCSAIFYKPFMSQFGNVLFCAVAVTLYWTVIGLPIAIRVIGRWYSWLLAPALGWASFNVLALPVFETVGIGVPEILGVAALGAMSALVFMWRHGSLAMLRMPTPLVLGVVAAALLAMVPTAGILPKVTSEGMTLASPIFDHSKIALVDEIIRSGVPARNPFFGAIDAPDRVAYYYLWHFSAALGGIVTGVTGWEADAALTGFTAFASLLTMICVAVHCGARPWVAPIVVVLAATASLRTTLGWTWANARSVIGEPSGFGAWLFQTSWAPQHVASATCVIIAILQVSRLAQRPRWGDAVALGLVAAASFQSSVWVGGVVFPIAATATGLLQLASLAPGQRWPFIGNAALAAAVAAVLAAPFAHDQAVAAAMRGDAALIAITPVSVLGGAIPEGVRRILDLPAYWLVYLPLEFPAFYLGGLIGLGLLVTDRELDDLAQRSVRALSILVAVSLVTAWLGASVIGDNNDLGWRAVLPGAMVLIALVAALLSRWPSSWSRQVGALAALGFFVSLPETLKIAGENIFGLRKPSEQNFAAAPELWRTVRRFTGVSERVANNPLLLRDMTPWPVNISWALMANRRSCYAGNELAIPFAPISAARRAEIETQFVRVFDGRPAADDLKELAERYRCDTVVVTVQDGAWLRDPFATSQFYRLVDSRPDRWRIYQKRTALP
jgi:hypothetical protein